MSSSKHSRVERSRVVALACAPFWMATLVLATAIHASAQSESPAIVEAAPPANPELPAGGEQAAPAAPAPLVTSEANSAQQPSAAETAAVVPAPAVAAQSTTAPPAPAPPPAAAESAPSGWPSHIKLGGGAILYYYQPFVENWDNDLSFFYGRIDLDVDIGAFGFHLEPRFRDSKLRPFYDGPAWIEEGYASWQIAKVATLKVGKLYSRLGLFWDNSFYGNVQVYDGLKLAPDYGASIEGTIGERIGLNYWAQFFLVDGRTNVSLDTRDTVSVPGGRRRNEIVLNVEPFVKFGDDGVLRVGASLQQLEADLPDDENSVLRLAAHAKLTVAGLGVWGEVLHQSGRHVTDFPIAGTPATEDEPATPGRVSGDNMYFLIGAEYSLAGFTLRYNVSRGTYSDVDIYEWMHVPAISYKIAEPLTLLVELVLWRRYTPDGDSDVDKSLNVTLIVNF